MTTKPSLNDPNYFNSSHSAQQDIATSKFEQRLNPLGRILEIDGYHVWCCSPIYGPDGRVHVFYSRWRNEYKFSGWVSACEVAHAVADSPEGPYQDLGVVLKGRGGDAWDSWAIHNPTIQKVGDRYALFYMGADGSTLDIEQSDLPHLSDEAYEKYYTDLVYTKRIGLAIATTLHLAPRSSHSCSNQTVNLGMAS